MSDYNLYEIDQMDGHSFEYFCADVLNRNGFSNVTVTKGSGDYGIDILAERNGQSFAIQCKRYNGRIGNKAVQEALSGCVYYGYDIPVVLTNSYFTEQAKETARRTNVELWDRETLMSFISTAYPSNAAFKYSSRQASKSNPKTSSSNPGCGKTILGLIIVVIFFSVISSLFKSCFGSKTEEPENTSSISSVQNTTASVDESTNQSNTTFDTPEASTKPVEETPFISRTVEENNVVYEISGDNATVLGLADSGTTLTHIEVLGEIEGTPVTSIADEAFNWCENLEEINLPGSITSIGKWAFRECTSLKHITIPNGVTAIESTTFSDCRSLTYIDLPEGLTSIGYDAFWNCGFSEIELPTSLESIDSSAFYVSWKGHFTNDDSTYINEKNYIEEKGINSVFLRAKDDEGTVANVLNDINKADCSDFIFLTLEYTDHNGHGSGFSLQNPKYVNGFFSADKQGFEFINAIKSRATYDTEDWLILITSDHGGINKKHGGDSFEERMTFIVSNKDI